MEFFAIIFIGALSKLHSRLDIIHNLIGYKRMSRADRQLMACCSRKIVGRSRKILLGKGVLQLILHRVFLPAAYARNLI